MLLEAYGGETPTALVERLWAYGRYLLLSSSRSGGNPCPLHGLWLGEYRGLWSFNMANENLQMIYWQALPGGMPETLLAVFDYYERRMDDFRANARNLYGCRGILIPANTAPDSGADERPTAANPALDRGRRMDRAALLGLLSVHGRRDVSA